MSPEGTDTRELIEAGYEALEQGEYSQAIEYGNQLLEIKHARGIEIIACALAKQKRYDEASEILKHGLSIVGEVAAFWEMLGNVESSRRKFIEAERAYESALKCVGACNYSIFYNMAVMYKNSGRQDRALEYIDKVELDSPLFFKAKGLGISILNVLERYEEAINKGTVLINEMLELEEITDAQMKDLAIIYADLGQAILHGTGDRQAAFESAWKALEWERSEPTALTLVRDIIARMAPDSRLYNIQLQGYWEKPLVPGGAPPVFYVSYEIVAANVDEALMFAQHLEPPAIRSSIQVLACEDKGLASQYLQGVYWRGHYDFHE